jgi:hypothetical protein
MVVVGEAAEEPHPASAAKEATAATMPHAVRAGHGRVVVLLIAAPPI